MQSYRLGCLLQKRKTMNKSIATTILCSILCASLHAQNSDYTDRPLPDKWNSNEIFDTAEPDDLFWWQQFGDSTLDSLISVATERNHSVLDAIENIRIAKATWRTARAGMLPSINLNAGWQRTKSSGNISSSGDTETWGGYFDAGVSASWQIDLFGKIYKRSRSEKHLFQASEEEFRSVMVSLWAGVATTYFSLRKSVAEMKVLRENVASQKEILGIVEVRYNSGLASRLDVAQARSVYYSTLASIPGMENAIKQYRNALAVLLAAYPEEFDGRFEEDKPLPDMIAPIAVGVPAGIMRRRPDVRAAEQRVEAYASALGAAKRDWLPDVYLNGSFGFASTPLNKLPRSRSTTWEIAPSVTWNLFDGGSTLQQTRQARAQLDKSIIQFNSTILTALQEVENAMTSYRSGIAQTVALRETVNQAEETLQLSLELYKQGLTEFQNVLDAQRTLLSYQDNLVQAQGNTLIALVQLYESLGGGW